MWNGITTAARNWARRFWQSADGNVAMMFGILIVPVILFAGAAIDYTRGSTAKIQFQTALDAAALAVGAMPDTSSQQDLEATAQEVFDANFRGQGTWGANIVVTKVGPILDLSIAGTLDTHFMGLAHINQLNIDVETQVAIGGGTIEVALVLDNSGSMGGDKLIALKTAATALVTTLFEGLPVGSTDLSFSLVPFATFVDIGEHHIEEEWMDLNAESSIHSENFNPAANRFDLYDNFTNVQWEGCVEARPYPYDVTDATPDDDEPDTLFVPNFAPDNPDNEPYSSYFRNNYIDDSNSGNYTIRQEHSHKYTEDDDLVAQTDYYGTTYNIGPSFLCRQADLVPLTDNIVTITTGITSMEARGATNIVQGLVWGWRTLSPGIPFTEGRNYTDNRNQKILILLTDGANSISSSSNFNGSLYSAYGFAKDQRLGNTSNSSSNVRAAINGRTSEACENIKDAGITIFSIVFDLDDEDTETLMRNCASTTNNYFNSPNSSDLETVFEEIAIRLRSLRLSR